MRVNQLPAFDRSDVPTGCCPRFNPSGWDDLLLTFERKPFVRASTISALYLPLNGASPFRATMNAVEQAYAREGTFLVLSNDDSPWYAEHLFAVDQDVPGADMVHLSGTYLTKVFEGAYHHAVGWVSQMESVVESRGKHMDMLYFFYTTCPRCAAASGKNHVVALAQVS